MPQQRPKNETWRNSKAKAMLKKMIEDEIITEETNTEDLFNSEIEFMMWDKAQFKRNLKALLKGAKNPKKKPNWAESEAKKILKQDIITLEVTDQSDPAEVYKMHPEYSEFEYQNFRTNMSNLIEKILSEFERMRTDCEYFGHDLALLAVYREDNPLPRTPWHKSEAKPLLDKDMEEGKHLTMKPKELFQTRIQYREFSLEEFRKRIHQEKLSKEKEERRTLKKHRRIAKPPEDYAFSSAPQRTIQNNL